MTTTVDVGLSLPLPPAPVETDTLVVVVKPEHIKWGQPGSSSTCAVALALREMGHNDVNVGRYGVRVGQRTYETGPLLRDWTRRFDVGDPVAPERFVLAPVTTSPETTK